MCNQEEYTKRGGSATPRVRGAKQATRNAGRPITQTYWGQLGSTRTQRPTTSQLKHPLPYKRINKLAWHSGHKKVMGSVERRDNSHHLAAGFSHLSLPPVSIHASSVTHQQGLSPRHQHPREQRHTAAGPSPNCQYPGERRHTAAQLLITPIADGRGIHRWVRNS